MNSALSRVPHFPVVRLKARIFRTRLQVNTRNGNVLQRSAIRDRLPARTPSAGKLRYHQPGTVNPGSALDRVSSNRIKQVMPGCEVQYSNQQHIILRSWRELSSNLTTNFFFRMKIRIPRVIAYCNSRTACSQKNSARLFVLRTIHSADVSMPAVVVALDLTARHSIRPVRLARPYRSRTAVPVPRDQ